MNSASFDIFKGQAAAKFSLLPPRFNEKGWVDKTGGVLIEAAKVCGTDGQNKLYDWKENKLVLSLGVPDICYLLENPETQKIVHEYNGKTKSVSFKESTDDRFPGSWMMSIREKDAEGTKQVSVPLTGGEFAAFGLLIKAALPKILNW